MKAERPTASARPHRGRPRRFGLWLSLTFHALAAWVAACLILQQPAPALVAAAGGEETGGESEPVALSHVAPPARVPHTAMPRMFPDKAPPLRSAASSALSLPAPALVFMPAPPVPAMAAPAMTSSAAARGSSPSSRQAGKGRGGRGKAGGRGDGRGDMAAAGGRPAAPASPLLLRSTAPEYPAGARSRGEHGTVWVRVLVSAGGRVQDAAVHRSCGHGDLDAAAVRTAKRWTFSPATVGGQAVSAAALVKVNFVLR